MIKQKIHQQKIQLLNRMIRRQKILVQGLVKAMKVRMEGAGTNQVWTSDTLSELTSSGGCGDYFVYAKNPDDTLALHISGSGLAMEAHQSDSGMVAYTYTIDPMTDDIQPLIVAQEGLYLNEWSCNDAAMNEPEITLEHMAISGTVQVTVEADGEMTDWGEVPANITLT